MPILIDTCIWIDFLHQRPGAVTFIQSLEEAPLLSPLVIAELFAGAMNAAEQQRIHQLRSLCKPAALTEEIAVQGGRLKAQYGPSHGVGLADALLAATSLVLHTPLATRNKKHFPMLEILSPY